MDAERLLLKVRKFGDVQAEHLEWTEPLSWNSELPSGVSATEHKLSFLDVLNYAYQHYAQDDVVTDVGEELVDLYGHGNRRPALRDLVFIGEQVACLIEMLPAFIPHPPQQLGSATRLGRLSGHWTVVRESLLPLNEFIVVHVQPQTRVALATPGVAGNRDDIADFLQRRAASLIQAVAATKARTNRRFNPHATCTG